MTAGGSARRARGLAPLAAAIVAGSAALAPGCVPPQLLSLRSGLDSLRAVVDTMQVRDSVAYQVLVETRREVAEQRDILLSTRAASGSTTQELFDQMSRLEAKLGEVSGRFSQPSRPAAPAAGGGPDPSQVYGQASQELTQGHYALALASFRDFVRRYPADDLADDAQYGVGECLFAQSRFDSALVEYARVEAMAPGGDRVPPALYKQALCEERLGREGDSRKTLEELVKRFPLAGEAQLARERLKRSKR